MSYLKLICEITTKREALAGKKLRAFAIDMLAKEFKRQLTNDTTDTFLVYDSEQGDEPGEWVIYFEAGVLPMRENSAPIYSEQYEFEYNWLQRLVVNLFRL